MKIDLKKIGILLATVMIATACSKDDDPADNDLFVGTYRGSINYVTDGETKSNDNGTVRVVKVGNDYNFIFSDGIPDLTGVKFKEDGDNAVISIDGEESKYIRISASDLVIGFAKDGKVWTANCRR